MRYAITYTDDFRHYDVIDEVIFNYQQFTNLVDFITSKLKYEHQTAIVSLLSASQNIDEMLPVLNKLKQEHPNMKVLINFFEHRNWISALQENGIEFIFSDFAKTPSILAAMIKLGASEVYLAEDMCFDLRKMQKFRTNGIKFRIWPDIAQTPAGTGSVLNPLSQFFVRPEDVEFYESLVDTMEFMRQGNGVNVIYEIYEQEQWLGNLEDIILDLNIDVDNTTIAPFFGQQRVHCGRRCLWSACDVCDRTQELAESLEKSKISLIKERKPKRIPKSIYDMVTKGEDNGSKSDEEVVFNASSGIADNVD